MASESVTNFMSPVAVNTRPETGSKARRVDYYRDWYRQNNGIKGGTRHENYLPWFSQGNDETEYLAHVLENNPILPGILATKAAILHSLGLVIFDENNLDRDGNPTMVPYSDWGPEITRFFEANDLDGWSIQTLTDWFQSGNAFSRYVFSKAKDKIIKLERAAWETVLRHKPIPNEAAKYGICGNWKREINETINPVKEIPAFLISDFYDSQNNLKAQAPYSEALYHFRLLSAHRPHYGIPPWYGARHWAEVANMVPVYHKSSLHNQFGARMGIHILEDYINYLKQIPLDNTDPANPIYPTPKQVMEQLNQQYGDYLHGVENVGKSIAIMVKTNERGEMVPVIKFVPIESQQDDERYVKLETPMNNAVTSSVGISPNLSGIQLAQSLGSGSETRLAWNVEVGKSGPVRHMILKALNFIHRFNRWPEGWVWGYKDVTMQTTDITRDGMVSSTKTPVPDGAV